MGRRKLWHHDPDYEWVKVNLGYSKLLQRDITDRELRCQVCGVLIGEHDAAWPKRPRSVFHFFLGWGKYEEFARLRGAELEIGFGPGLWVHPRNARVNKIGWRRLL